ncbi:hypothetical protein ACFL3G_01730 [Planctomycetota bacterium]
MRFRGGVTFWAVLVSTVIHLVVFGLFGITRFSRAQSQLPDNVTVLGSISQVKKLIEKPGVIAKPKVKRFRPAAVEDEQLLSSSIFTKPASEIEGLPNLSASSRANMALTTENNISSRAVEFFGSWTDERKICYVVDCSGSMKGLFTRVRKKLKASIASLEPDQYFYIIFFGSGKMFESGKGSLIRATVRSKAAAYNFTDKVKPAGQGDAITAMERAMRVRDNSGQGAGIIYFLTDGFELTNQSQRIAKLFKGPSSATKINTIGFWPQRQDRTMLESIAKRSGGKFRLIHDN